MGNVNYESYLPRIDWHPRRMLAKIQKRLPEFAQKGLFKSEEFVRLFEMRLLNIISNLPHNNPEQKESLERDIAYIQSWLYTHQDQGLGTNKYYTEIREMERSIEKDKKGRLQEYRAFSRGELETIDTHDSYVIGLFLKYLLHYAPIGHQHAVAYIQSCVSFSQIGGDDGAIFLDHVGEIIDSIPDEKVEVMIDQNGYLGGLEFDEHVQMTTEDEDISDIDAEIMVKQRQEYFAAFHLFLGSFYNKFLCPYINNLPEKEQDRIFSLLNDYRDLVDPGHFTPIFFHHGNWIETCARQKMHDDGCEAH